MGLYEERMELVRKTVTLEGNERVPVHCVCENSFAIQYCEMDYRYASWDPYVFGDAYQKVLTDFYWDSCDGMFVRPSQLYRELGSVNFVENQNGYVQHPEVVGLQADEYDELIADPWKCIVGKVLPRLYRNLSGEHPYGMYNLAKGAIAYERFFGNLVDKAIQVEEETQVPALAPGLTEVPFDYVADQLRSFTGISKDLRRHADKIIAACEAVLPLVLKAGRDSMEPGETLPWICVPLHMPPYLSTKQFEKFYWPTFKQFIETLVGEGYTLQLFLESDWSRYYDYLQELPDNGKLVYYFEYGDPAQAKKLLGDRYCLQGFYPVEMLKQGTKQECIDKAKEILDIMAPGGGYIFSPEKVIIDVNDINTENLKVVNEFVRDYALY